MRLIDLDFLGIPDMGADERISVGTLLDAPVYTFEGLTEYLEDVEEELENLKEQERMRLVAGEYEKKADKKGGENNRNVYRRKI